MKRARQGSVFALLVAALVPACTAFEPGSDVLLSDTGANQSAAPPGEDWSCLAAAPGRSETPQQPMFAGQETRIVYSARILDLSTGAVYPDIAVNACGISDVDCATPVASKLSVDAQGWVDVPLFEGFNGFLEFVSPTILPSVFFFVEPLEQQMRISYPFGVVSLASVQPLVQLAGIDQAPDGGFIAMRAFDCSGVTAPGVTFTIEGGGSLYYFIGGLPTGTAPATDGSGLGGFGDVPPGLALVGANTSDGIPIMPPRTVLIRSGWLSTLYAKPPGAAIAPAP
jgi:hypothetical protein